MVTDKPRAQEQSVLSDGKARASSKTSAFGTKSRWSHDSSKFYDSKIYKNASKTLVKARNLDKDSEAVIETKSFMNMVHCQSSEKIKFLKDNSVHLVITSPPYNVGKTYDLDLTLKQYLKFLRKIFSEMYRVLVDGGRVCINLANVGRKPYLPLTDMVSKMMSEIGFLMRGEIIWDKGTSATPSIAWGSWRSPSNPVLRDVHEYILIFQKGSYRRKSTVETKIETADFLLLTKSIWTFKTESARRVNHPAPFPVELPRRLLKLFSFEDDIVLDPFMGSGSTAIAALENKRRFIGIEKNCDFVAVANLRISKWVRDNA